MNQAKCAKWNEPYRAGRRWHVHTKDGAITTGQAVNLREAKKAAIAALEG